MVSNDRITKELGFKSQYSFENGIKDTVDWYISNNK